MTKLTPRGITAARAGYAHRVSLDPRPRYQLAGLLFLLVALVMLFSGISILALLFALVAAGLFYYSTRVKSVP